MNKLFSALAAATITILSVPAIAADMPARRMPVKAVPVAAATYNWTGLYVGVHAGYAWGELTSDANAAVDHEPSGGLFGGQIGYNWQSGQFVFGIEADLAYSTVKGDDGGVVPPGFTFAATSDMKYLGTVRGRLGLAQDRVLFYVTGGFAWSKVDVGMTVVGVGSAGDTLNLTGWTVGGGIEYAIAQNWTIRAEYLYVDFSKESTTVNIGGFPFTDTADKNLNIVRAALNYKM
ncbi:MAG TPA: outer membrane protein [Xanthobacteraceae bacterium]|nr:outer membrane protein [Xanthobacteraceae bacterium]